jgi:hypothetical protein
MYEKKTHDYNMGTPAGCVTGVSLSDPDVCPILNSAATENLLQPQAPEPDKIADSVLPQGQLRDLAGCTSNCPTYIGYDFDTDTMQQASSVKYVIDTFYTNIENSGVFIRKRPKTTGTLSGSTSTNGSTTATVNYTVNGTPYSFSHTWINEVKTNGSTVDVYYDDNNPSNGSFDSTTVANTPVQMIEPPGFTVPDFFAALLNVQNLISTITVNSVDECAARCENTPFTTIYYCPNGGTLVGTSCQTPEVYYAQTPGQGGGGGSSACPSGFSYLSSGSTTCTQSAASNSGYCTGFNFKSGLDNDPSECKLHMGTPDRIPISGTIGYRKTDIPSTASSLPSPPNLDTTNQGARCSDAPACNANLSKIINDPNGITTFSTSDIESCMYCPVRSFNRTGNTVTDEFGTSKQFASTMSAFDAMSYGIDGSFASHILIQPNNFYTFTKKVKNAANNGFDIVSGTFFYDSNETLHTVYDKTLSLSTPAWVTGGSMYSTYSFGLSFSYPYMSPTGITKTSFTPIDYITNGFMTYQGPGNKLICTSNDIYGNARFPQKYSLEEYSDCTFRITPATLKTFLKNVAVPVFRKQNGDTYWFDSDGYAQKFAGGETALDSFATVNSWPNVRGFNWVYTTQVCSTNQGGTTCSPRSESRFMTADKNLLIIPTEFWDHVTYGSDITATTGYTLSRTWTGLTCPPETFTNGSEGTCEPCPENSQYINAQCIPCPAGTTYDPRSRHCICPSATPYYDTVNNVCRALCSESPTAIYTDFVGKRCYAQCPTNIRFVDGTANVGRELYCQAACPSFSNGGICVAACPADKPVADNWECIAACPAARPYKDNMSRCVAQCAPNIRDGNTCVAQCPVGKPVINNGECIAYVAGGSNPCTGGTKLYTAAWTSPTCVATCPSDKRWSDSGICKALCPSKYDTDGTNYNCVTSCPAARTITDISNYCVASCPAPTYKQGTTCVFTCSGSTPLAVDNTRECVSQCSGVQVQDYVFDVNKYVWKCMSACSTTPTTRYYYNGVCYYLGCPAGTFVKGTTNADKTLNGWTCTTSCTGTRVRVMNGGGCVASCPASAQTRLSGTPTGTVCAPTCTGSTPYRAIMSDVNDLPYQCSALKTGTIYASDSHYGITENTLKYCPAGQEPNGTGNACQSCPTGKYSAGPPDTTNSTFLKTLTPANITCTTCPAGTYAGSTGSSSCTPCPAGTYFAGTGGTMSSVCNTCSAGTYSPSGSSTCTTCPTNMWSPQGSDTCAETCEVFASAKLHLVGTSQCVASCTGAQIVNTGQFATIRWCVPNPPDCTLKQSTTCSSGQENTCYMDTSVVTNVVCRKCPSGSIRGSTVSECTSDNNHIKPCVSGFTGSECKICADNFRWNGTDCVACPSNSVSSGLPAFSGVNYCTCTNNRGSPTTGCNTCATGYGGTNCDQCLANYTWTGNICAPCSNGTIASGPASGVTRTCTCTGRREIDVSGTSCMSCPAPGVGFKWASASGCATTACRSGYRCPGNGTEVQCTGHTTPNADQSACAACPAPGVGFKWASASGCATTACSSGYRCPGDGTEVQCTGRTTPNADQSACVACTTPASGQMWADPSTGCSTVACATGTAPTNGTSRALVSGVCTATCNRGYINDYGQCVFSAYSLYTETYNSRLSGTTLGSPFRTTRKACATSCYNNASCEAFVMDWHNEVATGNDNEGLCTLYPVGYSITTTGATQYARYIPVACPTGYTGLKCDRCAANYRWNGTSACVACPTNAVSTGLAASGSANYCNCPTSSRWDGTSACVACSVTGSTNGGTANGSAGTCTCPANYVWNGTSACVACQNSSTATAGSATSGSAGQCTCTSTRFTGLTCASCVTGYTGTSCATCATDYRWNTIACVTCPTNAKSTGLTASGTANFCNCPANYVWNGTQCAACQNGSTKPGDTTAGSGGATQCTCQANTSGLLCEVVKCPIGSYSATGNTPCTNCQNLYKTAAVGSTLASQCTAIYSQWGTMKSATNSSGPWIYIEPYTPSPANSAITHKIYLTTGYNWSGFYTSSSSAGSPVNYLYFNVPGDGWGGTPAMGNVIFKLTTDFFTSNKSSSGIILYGRFVDPITEQGVSTPASFVNKYTLNSFKNSWDPVGGTVTIYRKI